MAAQRNGTNPNWEDEQGLPRCDLFVLKEDSMMPGTKMWGWKVQGEGLACAKSRTVSAVELESRLYWAGAETKLEAQGMAMKRRTG